VGCVVAPPLTPRSTRAYAGVNNDVAAANDEETVATTKDRDYVAIWTLLFLCVTACSALAVIDVGDVGCTD
jgi:hypothetical protein